MPSSLAEGVPHQLITQRNAETGEVTYKRKREFDAILLFLSLGVKFGFYRNNVFAISQLEGLSFKVIILWKMLAIVG